MATPTLTRHRLDGALGPLLVDVRAAGRRDPAPAVVILHGFKGFKDWGMFPPFAERLARAGFSAIAPNLSGSGVDDSGSFVWPERFGHNTFSAELADVEGVVSALDRGDLGVPRPSTVGMVGHSRGGGVAILASGRSPRIRALVTWAAVASVLRWTPEQIREWRASGRLDVKNVRTGEVLPLYPDVLDDVEHHGNRALDIKAAASALDIPWLLIHGEADEAVPVAEAHSLAGMARRDRVQLLEVPRAGHTFGAVHPFAGPTPALEQVFDASATFLSRYLS